MRVLVACEFSGVVRRAFRERGHDAWSCDMIPAEDGSDKHIIGCALAAMGDNWDLMIAHPPCTFLCNSGVRWLFGGKGRVREEGRWNQMETASRFFRQLLNSKVPRIVIENPIPHGYALELIGRKYDQVIQPWQFGHPETKATCLWLKGLPPLEPTNIVEGRTPRVHHASPGPDRWKERSRTYAGIARAFAEQWG